MASGRFPILFITSSRLGDAVLSSGLVRYLAENIDGARFTIAASALTAPLFADVPGLDEMIVIEKRAVGRHWLDLWNRTRHRQWGLVVDLRGSPISGFLNRKRRAVWSKSPAPAHKVTEAARLLKIENDPPAPFIYVGETARARAEMLTKGEGPILAVAPAANWVGKVWPVERFAELARKLLAPGGGLEGGRLMVLGGPGDRAVAGALLGAAPRERRIDLIDREPLPVLSAVLAKAALFVGGDSGLMHLAAAAGAPTLGLFGPSDETLYAPWGEHTAIARGPRSFAAIKAADPKLNLRICHMTDLPVSTVLRQARALIAATAGKEAARA